MGAKIDTYTVPIFRWLRPYTWVFSTNSVSITQAGRTYLELFEVPALLQVDAIMWRNAATVAGNITVGIYGPIATEETATGAALCVQSESTAQAGANSLQTITFTPTTLGPGRYYAAIEFSDATATYAKPTVVTEFAIGYSVYFDQVYGVLPATVPATSSGLSNAVNLAVRVYKA